MIGKYFLAALVFTIVMTNNTIFCQQNNFNAGVIVGLNFSELEGNSITDYMGGDAMNRVCTGRFYFLFFLCICTRFNTIRNS